MSAYGMVESYRCTEVPETSSRVGLSLMLARDEWSTIPSGEAVVLLQIGAYFTF